MPPPPPGVARSITYVDEAAWREHLPADLILPEERAQAVRDLLDGITMPPGLTAEDLMGRDGFLANAIIPDRTS